MSNEAKIWSVNDVLELVPALGIPHFQRGSVWGPEMRAALLESLFFDTPCGSFVLWEPKDCASKGVALDPATCTDMTYLVIDGQQRIRSLHSVFKQRADSDESTDETEGQDDSTGDGRRVWCINLTKAPGYAQLLKAPEREFALFMHTIDPAERQAAKQALPLKDVLPLKIVLTAESWSSDALRPYRDLLLRDIRASEASPPDWPALYEQLREAVLAMKKRKFFVSVQKNDDLAEMANLFNRINAGGKRVEIEERAFAKLVGLQPNTYEELKRTFDAVHAKAWSALMKETGERLDRDEVLQRQKERAFGFKLFIRVFLEVCQHHLGFRQGKTDFSFDLASKGYFFAAFQKLTAQQSGELWTEAREVLEHVRGILREELACDDLRSLPDTSALTPVFQLLILYPALKEKRYRLLLAGLCLRLMLAELDSRTLLQLLHDAADLAQVAFRVIPKLRGVLKSATERSKLSARLQQANSIQNRYVLLLYWLERHLGAKDFLYANVPNPHRPTVSERPVDDDARPEKQHLLPFKKAQLLYRDDLRRGNSHIANSIGNLTYISAEENSFITGLGDAFAALDAEPLENKRAHLLVDQHSDHRVLKGYEYLRGRLENDDVPHTEKAKAIFERMARHRREVIAEAFEMWVQEIDAQASAALGLASLEELDSLARIRDRLEPVPPKFPPPNSQDVIRLIRELGLSNEDEDRMISLAQKAARVPPPRKGAKLERDLWLTKKRKRVWVNAKSRCVVLRFAPIVSVDHRRQIVEALEFNCSIAPIPEELVLDPVPDFHKLLELLKKLGPKIEEDGAGS